MQLKTDILRLKSLYDSFDQLKESGEDVVADIRTEINNIELQYLKEDVFPELMKILSSKISWLRCTIDMSLQFNEEKQLDYSFCKSGSTLFVRDKYECESQDCKNELYTDPHQSSFNVEEPAIELHSENSKRNGGGMMQNCFDCSLDGFRAFLTEDRNISPSYINEYCTVIVSDYIRKKVLKYHFSGYIFNIKDLQILSQLYLDVQTDFETNNRNSASVLAVRLYIQFVEVLLSKQESDISKSNNNEFAIDSQYEPEIQVNETKRKRLPPIIIESIKFNDFNITTGNTIQKYVDFFNLIGPELVYQMRIEHLGGYLVDKTRNPQYYRACKPLHDGYWLNTHCNTTFKINFMRRIGKALGIEVFIDYTRKNDNVLSSVSDDELSDDITMVSKRKKYSLNGCSPLNKRRLVLSVVSLYMKQHPRATWYEVLEAFPGELQGSYGVVALVKNIQNRITIGYDDNKRYFLEPSDLFTTIDGYVFAVSSQWGNQFDRFIEYVENKFGWTIKMVDNSDV